MKRRAFLTSAAAGAVVFPSVLTSGCAGTKYDLLITGGLVVDGTGTPGKEADVAVRGDRIVEIGPKLNPKRAREVIDAKGLVVTPGFIDPHTHTDVQLLANPKGESKIRQGVTTEMGGNCGSSYFPLSDASFEEVKKDVKKEFDVDVDWRDLKGFFARLEKSGVSFNYATLIGQGTIRDAVMGPYDKPPTPEQVDRMKALIREDMTAGAFGISSGLQYTPSCFAKQDELTALCTEVAALGGTYSTHMRSEEDEVLEAVAETIATAKASGVNLQISHIKANYPRNWSKIDGMIAAIDQAAKDGVKIHADRYPYIASATGLSSFFPKWAREGTSADFVNRLKDPALQAKLKNSVKEEEEKLGSWDKVTISSILSEKNRALEGVTVLAAAAQWKRTPYEFLRDILIEENGAVGMVQFGMCEENLKRFYSHPLVTAGSDGNAVAPYGILGRGKPHPRFYGTFPRYIARYVLEAKVQPFEEGIRRITSFTADKFGIRDRGRLAAGMFADITIFDMNRISDAATFQDPHKYAEGIPHVIVNGVAAVKNGEHTGALSGRILRFAPKTT